MLRKCSVRSAGTAIRKGVAMNVTTIAATKVETATFAMPEGGEPKAPVHALMSLVLHPGDAVQTIDGIYSVMLHVQQGTIRVTAIDAKPHIHAGTGAPIPYGTDEAELCNGGSCELMTEQPAVLGPGNQLSIKDGQLGLELVGTEPAMAYVSLLIPEPGPDTRCWICPQATM
jgi:hypothetical protein